MAYKQSPFPQIASEWQKRQLKKQKKLSKRADKRETLSPSWFSATLRSEKARKKSEYTSRKAWKEAKRKGEVLPNIVQSALKKD